MYSKLCQYLSITRKKTGRLLPLTVLGIVISIVASFFASLTDYLSIVRSSFVDQQCEPSVYSVHILSFDPLILHMQNFVTENERKQLLRIAEPLYERSMVSTNDGREVVAIRTSSTAMLNSSDHVLRCVSQRAAEFQAFTNVSNIETIQVTRYMIGQEYQAHYDWMEANPKNRATTIFAILQANCSDCGTAFPGLRYNWAAEDPKICEYVDCGKDSLVIQPIPGNALFWRNLHANGTGDSGTLHAGLPVSDGSKIGLNIWTKEGQEGPGEEAELVEKGEVDLESHIN